MLKQRPDGKEIKVGSKGLFLEDTGDGLQLIVVFDQAYAQGELVIPLTVSKAGKLSRLLQDALSRRAHGRAEKVLQKTVPSPVFH